MNNYLYVEKYRPHNVDDIILSDNVKKTFSDIVKSKNIPHMLFYGPPGCGKTTVAKAICNESHLDYIMINGSDERNIDTLRHKIKQFATTVSFNGGLKIVILDEFDGSSNILQTALRAFMEEFHNNCRFIITCNFKNKIIEAIHSRCQVYNFNINSNDLSKICANFFIRLKNILDNENVTYNDLVLVELIKQYAPDWRRILNECQKYAITGNIIDTGIFAKLDDLNFNILIKALKEKHFKNMHKWVINNNIDFSVLFHTLYDNMYKIVEEQSIPNLVLIIAEYQAKSAVVMDQEINTVACLTEIMGGIKFK